MDTIIIVIAILACTVPVCIGLWLVWEGQKAFRDLTVSMTSHTQKLIQEEREKVAVEMAAKTANKPIVRRPTWRDVVAAPEKES